MLLYAPELNTFRIKSTGNENGNNIRSFTNFENKARVSSVGKIFSSYFLKSECLMHPLRDVILKTDVLLTHGNYVFLYDRQNQQHFIP